MAKNETQIAFRYARSQNPLDRTPRVSEGATGIALVNLGSAVDTLLYELRKKSSTAVSASTRSGSAWKAARARSSSLAKSCLR